MGLTIILPLLSSLLVISSLDKQAFQNSKPPCSSPSLLQRLCTLHQPPYIKPLVYSKNAHHLNTFRDLSFKYPPFRPPSPTLQQP